MDSDFLAVDAAPWVEDTDWLHVGDTAASIRLFTHRETDEQVVVKLGMSALSYRVSDGNPATSGAEAVARYAQCRSTRSEELSSVLPDEFREFLASRLARALGDDTPRTYLCFIPPAPPRIVDAMDEAELEPRPARALHLAVRFDRSFRAFDRDFVTRYKHHTQTHRDERFHIVVEGRQVPLHGLGRLLCIACLLDDRDCLGLSALNAGFIIAGDTGHAEAQKISLSGAFECCVSGATDVARDRIIYDRRNAILLSDLNRGDREEFFAAVAHTFELVVGHREASIADDSGELWRGCFAPFALMNPAHAERVAVVCDTMYNRFLSCITAWSGDATFEATLTAMIDDERAFNLMTEQDPQRVEQEENRLNERLQRLGLVLDAHKDRHAPRCETFQVHNDVANFVGRTTELATLMDIITGPLRGFVKIVGTGGAGKTALARKLAVDAAAAGDSFGRVAWLRAEGRTDVDLQLIRLAESWTGMRSETAASALALLYDEDLRRSAGHCLVVLDNVVDPSVIEQFLEKAPVWLRLVVTTRLETKWEHESTVVNINCFSRGDSYAFIRDALGEIDDQLASDLSEEMHDLALALRLAVGFILRQHVIITQFLGIFRIQLATLSIQGALPTEEAALHPRTIGVLVSMALNAIANQETTRCLKLLTFFSPDDIEETVLTNAKLTPSISPADAERVLRELVMYGLVERHREERTFAIHRLIQACVRHFQTREGDTEANRAVAGTVISDLLIGDEYRRKETSPNHLANGTHFLAISQELGFGEDAAWENVMEHMGGVLSSLQGDHRAALRYYAKLYENNVEYLSEMATCYLGLGQAKRAHEMLVEALRRHALKGPDPELYGVEATMRNDLAKACEELGDLDEALRNADQARDRITTRRNNVNHPDVIAAEYRVVWLRALRGESDCLRGLRDLYVKIFTVFPETHLFRAYIMHIYGWKLGEAGDLPMQIFMQDRALEIIERYHGAAHATLVPFLLGHGRQGSPARQEIRARRAKAILEARFGDACTTHYKYAEACYCEAMTVEAPLERLAMLRPVLNTQRDYYGALHPIVAETLYHMGEAAHQSGDGDAARELWQEAATIMGRLDRALDWPTLRQLRQAVSVHAA